MAKGDIPKMAVITPFGLFEWIRMPFGLRNAGCTFQRMMDQILGDIPHYFVYFDDLLIASPDATSHLRHVRQVFDCRHLHGLSINPAKCEFAKPEVAYLGMRVSSKGCFSFQKHTEVISTFPRLVDKKGLQRFLGILNFYRRFINGASRSVHQGFTHRGFIWFSRWSSSSTRSCLVLGSSCFLLQEAFFCLDEIFRL